MLSAGGKAGRGEEGIDDRQRASGENREGTIEPGGDALQYGWQVIRDLDSLGGRRDVDQSPVKIKKKRAVPSDISWRGEFGQGHTSSMSR